MTNVETARALLAALNVRQVGHSTAQRKGWENVTCILVVANQRQAAAAHEEGASAAVTLDAVRRGALRARPCPVVVEHDALRLVLQGLLDRVDGLEGAYEREHARLSEVLGILSEFLPPVAEIRPALAALKDRTLAAEETIVRIESAVPRLTGFTIEQLDELDDARLAALVSTRDRALTAEAEEEKLREAVLWALGMAGDFPVRAEKQGSYYWRGELARRAGIDMNRAALVPASLTAECPDCHGAGLYGVAGEDAIPDTIICRCPAPPAEATR